jgi:hypothetical protein
MRWGVGQPVRPILAMRPVQFLRLGLFFSVGGCCRDPFDLFEDLLRLYPGPFERFKGWCQRTELAPGADVAMKGFKSVT